MIRPALALLIAVALAAAPLAHADAADDAFVNSLREVNDPSILTLVDATPGLLAATGRQVCAMLDQGYGFQAIQGMVLDQLPLRGPAINYYAGLFGVYAVANYCPAHQKDSGFNGSY
jgi:hypothetical protein